MASYAMSALTNRYVQCTHHAHAHAASEDGGGDGLVVLLIHKLSDTREIAQGGINPIPYLKLCVAGDGKPCHDQLQQMRLRGLRTCE